MPEICHGNVRIYMQNTAYLVQYRRKAGRGGMHVVRKKRDIHDAMRLADQKMYSNKAKLKDSKERRIAAHREATIRVMHEALGSGMWGMEFGCPEGIQ